MLLSLFRFILDRRYDVTITGLEHLKKSGSKMVMPNHPWLIDPIIVFSYLSQYLELSPVVTETYYDKPILHALFRQANAVPMGDMQRGTGNMNDISSSFDGIIEGLRAGKNILLYPSGQIYSQDFESIIGKKSVYEVVARTGEDTRFIAIRTKGVWGSTFSKAWNGRGPNFLTALVQSIGILMVNGVFFAPKRKITITVEDFTDRFQKISNENHGNIEMIRNTLNKTLEKFYNEEKEPSQIYVPHFWFWNNIAGKEVADRIEGSLTSLQSTNGFAREDVPDEVWEIVVSEIVRIKNLPRESIGMQGNFILDYYFDSLDMAELKASVQSKSPGSSNPPMADLKTVGDIVEMAMGHSGNTEKPKDCEWIRSNNKTPLYDIIKNHDSKLGDSGNVLSLFREVFKNDQDGSFVYDAIFWLQSRKEFLIKAYLIAWYLKNIEGDRIGIMLPSVASSSIVLIATYLAGKVPVMLNWTVGELALLHCIDFARIDHILTSKSFYEKVKNEGTEKIAEKYIYLEELLKEVSLYEKIRALIDARLFRIPKLQDTDYAVILFTSGSESLPKAVSLTHRNIISDILWSLLRFPITANDVLIGFLPPFHSFGFTINTVMPLISGLRAAYTPDPSDAKTISNLIAHTKATTLTATPTFLKMILASSSSETLKTLRYGVVGAEKCPESLFETFTKLCPEAKILEWYGITECSPVISINPPKLTKRGSVGLPIAWLDITILSLDGKETMDTGKEGMIYVRGPSVFGGYLDGNIESPFEDIDNMKQYKTGDLGYLDTDGYLYITGRLKRFVKIAGEMISLPFIEEILLKKYGKETELTVAIEAKELNGETKIVLFTTLKIPLAESQGWLRDNKISNLVKISEVQEIDFIPVLWTGKIDYKALKVLIEI